MQTSASMESGHGTQKRQAVAFVQKYFGRMDEGVGAVQVGPALVLTPGHAARCG
jgi:hypothetical protein